MPTTTKRFYIVKADDHAVVKSVPVSVCAAPPRAPISATSDAPTCPIDSPAAAQQTDTGRDSGAVKPGVRRPALLHRPHLPHIGRPGR